MARRSTERQKWLTPLLAQWRDPLGLRHDRAGVASSDATNIATRIERDGGDYVINGRKWWISGAGDPRCKYLHRHGQDRPGRGHAHAAVHDPGAGVTRQASPWTARLTVLGYDDAPHGHCEIDVQERARAGGKHAAWAKAVALKSPRAGSGLAACITACDSSALSERCAGTDVPTSQQRASPSASRSPRSRCGTSASPNRACMIDQARLLTLKAAWT